MGHLSRHRALHSTGALGRVLGVAPLLPGGSIRGVAAVVLPDGREPETGDVDPVVPVHFVLLEVDVDSFLDASGVPMLVLVYTLHTVPVGVVASSPDVFSYR